MGGSDVSASELLSASFMLLMRRNIVVTGVIKGSD